MVGPPVAPPRPSWTGSTWLKGAAVGGWLVACDAWVKVTAAVAACPSTPTIRDAIGSVYVVPPGCGEADFWGFARLSPVVRDGALLGLGAGSLGDGPGRIWAYALIAIAAVLSVLVLRWRWRSPGDALALGALWGAVIVLGLPRLLGAGAGMAELHLGGMAVGLGDFGLLWALAWLGWRAVAEARA